MLVIQRGQHQRRIQRGITCVQSIRGLGNGFNVSDFAECWFGVPRRRNTFADESVQHRLYELESLFAQFTFLVLFLQYTPNQALVTTIRVEHLADTILNISQHLNVVDPSVESVFETRQLVGERIAFLVRFSAHGSLKCVSLKFSQYDRR